MLGATLSNKPVTLRLKGPMPPGARSKKREPKKLTVTQALEEANRTLFHPVHQVRIDAVKGNPFSLVVTCTIKEVTRGNANSYTLMFSGPINTQDIQRFYDLVDKATERGVEHSQ